MLVSKTPDCGKKSKHYKELPMRIVTSSPLKQEVGTFAMGNDQLEEIDTVASLDAPEVIESKNINNSGTFMVMFETEKEPIGELLNKVSEQIDKATKRGIIRAYQYDEMHYKNQGCLLIDLKLKRDGEKTLRDILNEVEGISRIHIRPFDTCLVAFDEFMTSKE